MRVLTTLAGLISLLSWALAEPSAPTVGEEIYLKGILPSGVPVRGDRESGGATSGAIAACVNCHRPSGLGTVEGGIVVPPVTAKYLFQRGAAFARESNYAERSTRSRSPYSDATLVRAIRDGIDPDGRKLDYLMPRYNLDKATMDSLVAYLKQLSSGPPPGVTLDTIHFATVITPDADPVKRKGMLDVIEHFVAAKNVFYHPIPAPVRFTKMMYNVPHKWQLHVWDLTGGPETWTDQLRRKLAAEPVFALLSGLGGSNWEPVHRFCREESVPCLFPNVDLPVVDKGDFYSVYFSRGVLLESQLIAHRIRDDAESSGIPHVVQVYREDDVGAAAARALHSDLVSHNFAVIEQPLTALDGGAELAAALEKAGERDTLILWLRPRDLRNLPASLPRSSSVFASGLMGGVDDIPLKGAWRAAVRMTYPFEIPSRRGVLMDYPLGWFRSQHINVIAEETQIETYIACNIVSESFHGMLDDYLRDYLLENIEDMLSTRIINGYFTRLGLAPGQRFASKGGYIVRFGGTDEKKLIPVGDWTVP